MEDKDTKRVGNITELEVLTYATKLGYQVSIPFGDRARYDQIWDVKGKLFKIQVKSAHMIGDYEGIGIFCKSSNRRGGKVINRRYTSDDADFFATYYDGKCYLIPINETSGSAKKLRFAHPKNNQLLNINWATDYEVEKVIQTFI